MKKKERRGKGKHGQTERTKVGKADAGSGKQVVVTRGYALPSGFTPHKRGWTWGRSFYGVAQSTTSISI